MGQLSIIALLLCGLLFGLLIADKLLKDAELSTNRAYIMKTYGLSEQNCVTRTETLTIVCTNVHTKHFISDTNTGELWEISDVETTVYSYVDAAPSAITTRHKTAVLQ